MLKKIGEALASVGLPLLGTAIGGPVGGVVGKGIAEALGLGDCSDDELLAKIKRMEPETYAALKKYEMDNAASLAQMAMDYDTLQLQGQIDLLKGDQKSKSLFHSGWRPFIGWTCAFGLAYTFGFRPLFPWFVEVVAIVAKSDAVIPALPAIDSQALTALVVSMLGLGGARTWEKLRGAD